MQISISLRGKLRITIFYSKVAARLLLGVKILSGGDKKGEFKQERMFGMVAKYQIANTSNELVEMDF